MRRNKQSLPREQCEQMLRRATAGVLALAGKDAQPYAVPLSHAYENGTLYFHCATEGKKLELLRENPKASFCVIDLDDVIPEAYTTRYRSVIACGTVRILEAGEEYDRAIRILSDRFRPGHHAERDREIDKQTGRFLMLALSVEQLSGKQAKELL